MPHAMNDERGDLRRCIPCSMADSDMNGYISLPAIAQAQTHSDIVNSLVLVDFCSFRS